MIYWDTSVVIKLYVQESDSSRWEKIALTGNHTRASSVLLESEFAFAVRQKELRGEVKAGGASHLSRRLNRDIAKGFIQLYPLSAEVISRSIELVLLHSERMPLRTLDGLHLATALLLDVKSMATADERLSNAARLLGISLVHLK